MLRRQTFKPFNLWFCGFLFNNIDKLRCRSQKSRRIGKNLIEAFVGHI